MVNEVHWCPYVVVGSEWWGVMGSLDVKREVGTSK